MPHTYFFALSFFIDFFLEAVGNWLRPNTHKEFDQPRILACRRDELRKNGVRRSPPKIMYSGFVI